MSRPGPVPFAALVTLVLVWGYSWIVMKIALRHAHPFDFGVLENGQVAWDMLFASTRPSVIMQMDIGNCAAGGGDPIGTLRKFPHRARSVHLKDYGGPPDSVIGEGKADWAEVFRLCETQQNTEWYVVEEGGAGGLGFDICQRSLQALRRMGK